MSYGYIYCFYNPSMPKLLKIGMTERTVDERLKEANLHKTFGPPLPFEMVTSKRVKNPKIVESKIHKFLDDRRVDKNYEYFEITREKVISLFDLIEEHDFTEKQKSEIPILNLSQINETPKEEQEIKQGEKTPRSINFSDYLTDSQRFRHTINGKMLIGIYKNNIGLHCTDGMLFQTLVSFVRHHEQKEKQKPKGSYLWKECEIEIKGEWKKFEPQTY